MSDKTCKTCIWWEDGICGFVDAKHSEREPKRFEIDIKCLDDQSLEVYLFTGPDFGCVHHAKNVNMPQYLIRPDDHHIFSINDNGTYSTYDSKIQFPKHLHHEYTYDRLIRAGFYAAPEEELSYHRQRLAEYHRNLSKESGCGD